MRDFPFSVIVYHRIKACKERTESREINGVSVGSYDLLSKITLPVLAGWVVILIRIKRLAANFCAQHGKIEKILDTGYVLCGFDSFRW
jgi:hypothetical protein